MASLKQVALALLAVSSFAAASPYDKRSVLANRATCNIQKRHASHKSAHAKKPRKSMMPGQSMSNLGTLSNPPLPKYLGPAGPDGLPPWGNRTVNNTNPYEDTPDTGVTRYYQFHIENITVAPDGVPTEGLVVNGQYPGPMIEANWGDWIEVNVMNHLDEGTTMHWHGMLQKESQWFDGVPGVQQCPISPGVNQSLTYRFRADLYGTTWYHSHYSAQYSSGLTGPMVVYGPKNIEDDIDLGPVFVQDWYHQTYQELLEYVIGQNVSTYEPPPYAPPNPPGVPFGAQDPNLSNNLINGRNYFPCNNTYCEPDHAITKFRFQSGKNMRLRLINAGSEAGQQFSIDNHNFSVVTNDMVPIQPFEASSITLSVGQRADIIVPAIGKPTDAVFMRSAACSTDPGNSPQAVAAIYYEHADTHKLPTTNNPEFQQCGVPDLESGTGFPWYPIAPGEPTTTIVINITAASNGTNLLWTMNNSTYHADFDLPTLLGAKIGMDNFAPNQNVYNTGSNATVRVIWYNYAGGEPHPMHLHGHNVFQISQGYGLWNGTADGDPNNPVRRDTVLLGFSPAANVPAYLVTQWNQDNPGLWSFHCHIAWHLSGGMNVQFLERPADVMNLNIPRDEFTQQCCNWLAWEAQHPPDEIDSGI